MLKLYPSDSQAEIVVGSINRDNFDVKLTANNNPNGKTGTINVIFAMPAKTGDGFKNWLLEHPDRGTYQIDFFLDPAKKQPSGIGVILEKTASSINTFNIDFQFIRGFNGERHTFSKFYIPSGWTSGAGEVGLYSVYGSDEELDNQTEELKYFIRTMIGMEKDIETGTSGYDGKNLGFSPLISPFVPIQNNVLLSFDYYPRDFSAGSSTLPAAIEFISSATMHYMFFGKPLLSIDPMHIGNLEFTPAASYSPSQIDTSTLGYFYDSREIPATDYEVEAFEVDFESTPTTPPLYTITEYTTAQLQFLQIGTGDVFLENAQISDNGEAGNYSLGSPKQTDVLRRYYAQKINKFNFSSTVTRFNYFIQVSDSFNMSRVCKDLGEDTSLSNVSNNEDYKMPAFAVGYAQLQDSSIGSFHYSGLSTTRYGTSEGNGIFTGIDALDFFYAGEVVQPETPDYNIPDDSGGGGNSNADSGGGNGTWSDVSDNTGQWTGDPALDPVSPMPPSLGLDGNYKLLHMDRAAIYSLAQQSWMDGGWLKFLASTQGSSRIGEGVVDFKACFADIPTIGNFTLRDIGGFEIGTPIACSVAQQYTSFNMGSLDIPRYFDSYLDYSPFTEFTLELPFAEPVKIPPELIVGDSLKLTLRIDALSGTALYQVFNSSKLITQTPADVFISVPFGASEFTGSRVQAVFDSISAIATGAAVGGGIGGGIAGPAGAVAGAAIGAGGNLASDVTDKTMDRHITLISDGGSPAATGAMGIKSAILKTARPYVQIPSRYYEMKGCPSGYVKTIRECTGYFEGAVVYGRIPCNDDEYDEIVNIIAGGVFP